MKLDVIWHENRRSILSVRKEPKRLVLRLHRLFENAPAEVQKALMDFSLHRSKSAKAILRRAALDYFKQTPIEAEPLVSKGDVYDLQEMLHRIDPACNLTIGWARWPHSNTFRSITFGSFDVHRRQIRIHPFLDHPQVPPYFVEFIVYHEWLHAQYPTTLNSEGRCSIHSPAFRKAEKQFPRFQEATAWSKKSLQILRRIYGRS